MRITNSVLALSLIVGLMAVEVLTTANAAAYNPFDCSQRWGSNSSACNTGDDRGGRGGGGGGRGGGGGGHR